VFCDAAFLSTRDVFWAHAAIWLLGVGLVFGTLAATAGFLELGKLKAIPEAELVFSMHAIAMLAAFGAAAASFLGRLEQTPSNFSWPHIASAVCLLLMVCGAYFGGELVYKFGFGQCDQNKHSPAS
jgi:uncharacterized membrane protein